MPNQVKLTFAGESTQLESTFDRVGAGAETMSSRVGDSSAGFDRAGEAADGAESRAQGFSDTLTGTADIAAGTSEIMKGNLFEGFVTAGQGAADLAGGFAEFLLPALKATRVATVAQTVATNVASGATKAFTVAQRLLSAAFLTSPIGWIVLGIGLLIGAVVLIATKTDWFQRLWRNSWKWIKEAASNTWDWLKALPGRVGNVFASIGRSISAPFKAAFNAISRAWNNTVGQLSFTVPSWVPGIGGNSFSAPQLPTFHSGGVVPGVPGTPTVALLQAGETVSSIASSARGDGAIVIGSDGSRMGDLLVEIIAAAVKGRGGDPAALGLKLAR